MTYKFLHAAALTAVISALPGLAHAQFATDSNAPITGSSDSVDYQKDVSVFSGQVDIRQADVRILSDVMKVYSGGSSNTSGGEAFGDVELDESLAEGQYRALSEAEIKSVIHG